METLLLADLTKGGENKKHEISSESLMDKKMVLLFNNLFTRHLPLNG
jgi:hypothetical protein